MYCVGWKDGKETKLETLYLNETLGCVCLNEDKNLHEWRSELILELELWNSVTITETETGNGQKEDLSLKPPAGCAPNSMMQSDN